MGGVFHPYIGLLVYMFVFPADGRRVTCLLEMLEMIEVLEDCAY